MNETVSTRHGLASENIEKRGLNPKDGKYFQEICHFVRLRKIQDNQMRNDKYNQKLDRRKKNLKKSFKSRKKKL